MKYELKDKKLAELFRSLYSDFDKVLEEEIEDQMENGDYFILLQIPRSECELPDHIHIYKSEIKKPYDPNVWNNYPIITPPNHRLMRIEYRDGLGAVRRTCGIFSVSENDSFWIDSNGNKIVEFQSLRFRPWED